jgi:large subunit ribosomal protein L23
MTVELESPFVWPEEPDKAALKDFNKDQVDAAKKEQEGLQETQGPLGKTVVNEERRTTMREQAKALLEGRAKWRPATDGRGFGTMEAR